MAKEFYMTREDELVKQPDALPMFEYIAAQCDDEIKGADVFNALWSFWNFAHALDDLIDEPEGKVPEAKEIVLKVVFDFVGNLLITPQDHSYSLPMQTIFGELLEDSGWNAGRKALAREALKDFTGNLLANPFFRDHAHEHKSMFDMIIARTLDADELERTRPHLKPLLPAVRCADVDFIVHCAKLAGGWKLMREIGKLRDYDVDDVGHKSVVWKI